MAQVHAECTHKRSSYLWQGSEVPTCSAKMLIPDLSLEGGVRGGTSVGWKSGRIVCARRFSQKGERMHARTEGMKSRFIPGDCEQCRMAGAQGDWSRRQMPDHALPCTLC